MQVISGGNGLVLNKTLVITEVITIQATQNQTQILFTYSGGRSVVLQFNSTELATVYPEVIQSVKLVQGSATYFQGLVTNSTVASTSVESLYYNDFTSTQFQAPSIGVMKIVVLLSANGTVTLTRNGTSATLNAGTALSSGSWYEFSMVVNQGDVISLSTSSAFSVAYGVFAAGVVV